MELELIPLIKSTNLPDEVYEELESSGIYFDSFDNNDYVLDMNWEDNNSIFANWLVSKYGNIIKVYSTFAFKN